MQNHIRCNPCWTSLFSYRKSFEIITTMISNSAAKEVGYFIWYSLQISSIKLNIISLLSFHLKNHALVIQKKAFSSNNFLTFDLHENKGGERTDDVVLIPQFCGLLLNLQWFLVKILFFLTILKVWNMSLRIDLHLTS